MTQSLTTAALTVVLSLTLASGDVAAQEAGVDRTAAARALFQEGLDHLYADRWEEAADRFQRAMALRSSPQITYNLTTALIPLGRLVRASELLRQLIRDPTAPSEIRADAEARREELMPRLASLTVRSAASLEGAQLFLDERPIDEVLVGVAFPVDPGSHVVSARRGRDQVVSMPINLAEGEAREVVIEEQVSLGFDADVEPAHAGLESGDADLAVEPPVEGAERPPRRSIARRWWFWTIIGTVIVGGAVTAGVLGSRARDLFPQEVQDLDHTFFIGGEE